MKRNEISETELNWTKMRRACTSCENYRFRKWNNEFTITQVTDRVRLRRNTVGRWRPVDRWSAEVTGRTWTGCRRRLQVGVGRTSSTRSQSRSGSRQRAGVDARLHTARWSTAAGCTLARTDRARRQALWRWTDLWSGWFDGSAVPSVWTPSDPPTSRSCRHRRLYFPYLRAQYINLLYCAFVTRLSHWLKITYLHRT